MSDVVIHRMGDSWPGRGPHTNHTITAIEWWPTRADPNPNGGIMWTSGRVRCTCGVEWDTAIWPPLPPELTHLRVAENETLCLRGGDSRVSEVWGQYLSDDPSKVGCPKCLEWMHA